MSLDPGAIARLEGAQSQLASLVVGYYRELEAKGLPAPHAARLSLDYQQFILGEHDSPHGDGDGDEAADDPDWKPDAWDIDDPREDA
jgi:hypothetical protein